MSCSSACVAAAAVCCVPAQTSKANQLGFQGAHACCLSPCIQLPPYNVQICLTVNKSTQARIEQGCAVNCLTGEGAPECQLAFSSGQTLDSWGKRCRTINWSRQVAAGTYIRIQLCAADGCGVACPASFGSGSGYVTSCLPNNALQRFSINGVDMLPTIAQTAEFGGETAGCLVKAACIGDLEVPASIPTALRSQTGCCDWYVATVSGNQHQVVSWSVNGGGDGLGNLPVLSEIVIGPIGDIPAVPASWPITTFD